MKRTATLGLVLCALFLSGCVLSVNLALEGPDGLVAVVLSPEGGYDLFPEGGAIWVLDPDGYPIGDPFVLAEGQHARVCDWSPDGSLLLVVLTDLDEDGFPIRWRVVELPVTGDPHEVLVSEELILSPRYLSADALVYLKAGEEQVSLCSLAIATGAEEVLHEDALAFLPAGEGAYVLGKDGAFRTLAGEELPIWLECSEESCQPSFLFFPELLLAMDGTGRYLAIVLEEKPMLVSPEVERMPTLYLVDLVEETAERIATPALSPSFSPDGGKIAFVGQALDRPVQEIFLFDLATGAYEAIPGSEAAVWVRWGRHGLLAAMGEDPYRLVRWTGETWTDLLAGLPRS
ncbi:MAG: hypothetical protein ABID40_00920 [Candidatus Bipolaricaulota bacterium]